MLPEKRLELIHLQLTRNCNLRCWFCGQWGKKGFFSNASGKDMTLNEWLGVIKSLIRYRKETGYSPSFMLWGGEPLVSVHFEEIALYLYNNNFNIGMVTNGVLLDRHIDLCKKVFKKIYVSIDGPKDIHDSIRGQGTFDKVSQNIHKLAGGNAEIIIMSVITPQLLNVLPEFPYTIEHLKPNKLLLQEMISLSKEEVERYTRWLAKCFNKKADEIYTWQMEADNSFNKRKKKLLKDLLKKTYPFPIKYLPHGDEIQQAHCLSPFRHIHVTWNGNVMYCTDFYDFSAGNVRDNDIIDIFNNDKSNIFARELVKGNCITCEHCAWKAKDSFLI